MTYSYIHRKINEEAFPSAINLYDEINDRKRKGKIYVQTRGEKKGEDYIKDLINEFFPDNKIVYFS